VVEPVDALLRVGELEAYGHGVGLGSIGQLYQKVACELDRSGHGVALV